MKWEDLGRISWIVFLTLVTLGHIRFNSVMTPNFIELVLILSDHLKSVVCKKHLIRIIVLCNKQYDYDIAILRQHFTLVYVVYTKHILWLFGFLY